MFNLYIKIITNNILINMSLQGMEFGSINNSGMLLNRIR